MHQQQHSSRRHAAPRHSSERGAAGDADALNERLVALMERTGYAMVQENGQRRYGGPPPLWHAPPPPPEAELYVARIPQCCFEVTIYKFLQFTYSFLSSYKYVFGSFVLRSTE